MCNFLLTEHRSLVWLASGALLLLLIVGVTSPGYSAPSLSALTKEYSNYTPSDPDCKNLKDTTSIAYHSATGKVYISTDLGCIAEIDPDTLDVIRSKDLNQGAAHQLASDGSFISHQL